MKRLVILTLVLGLAAAANAHLQLTLNNSTAQSAGTIGPFDWCNHSIQVGIYKDDTVAESTYIDYDLGDNIGMGVNYNLSNVALTANAGNLATVEDNGIYNEAITNMGIIGPGQEYWVYIGNSTGFSSPPGQVFNSTISHDWRPWPYWGYHVNIYLWNEAGDQIIDTATITLIPEPITFALLGLGALVLRKRK